MASTPYEMFYVSFKGKSAELRTFDKRIVRKFTMKADIVNAQVQGSGKEAYVAITCMDGKTYLYTSEGRLVRRS